MSVAVICLSLLSGASLTGFFVIAWRYRQVIKRFAAVLSLDQESARLKKEIHQQKEDGIRDATNTRASHVAEIAQHQTKSKDLSQQYAEAKKTFDRLQGQITALQDTAESMSFGLYKPQYTV